MMNKSHCEVFLRYLPDDSLLDTDATNTGSGTWLSPSIRCAMVTVEVVRSARSGHNM